MKKLGEWKMEVGHRERASYSSLQFLMVHYLPWIGGNNVSLHIGLNIIKAWRLRPGLRLMSNKEGILVLPLIRVLFGILFFVEGGILC